MSTIINDTENRDVHILAGLITLIKVMGPEAAAKTVEDLTEWLKTEAAEAEKSPVGE